MEQSYTFSSTTGSYKGTYQIDCILNDQNALVCSSPERPSSPATIVCSTQPGYPSNYPNVCKDLQGNLQFVCDSGYNYCLPLSKNPSIFPQTPVITVQPNVTVGGVQGYRVGWNAVPVSWDDVTYNVYRTDQTNPIYSVVSKTAAPIYYADTTATQDNPYTYYVTAVTPLATVTSNSVTVTPNTGLSLTWSQTPRCGTNNVSTGVLMSWTSNVPNTTFSIQKVGVTDPDENDNIIDATSPYVDTNIQSGHQYTYQVNGTYQNQSASTPVASFIVPSDACIGSGGGGGSPSPTPSPPPTPPQTNPTDWIPWIIAAICVIALIVVIVLVWKNWKKKEPEVGTEETAETGKTAETRKTVGTST